MVVDYSLTASEVLNLIKNLDLEDMSKHIAPSSASHTDCILQQLVVTFTKTYCFPAGRVCLSLLFYFEIRIGSLAPWTPAPLAP